MFQKSYTFESLTEVEMDHQTLLDQTMNITTLGLDPKQSSIEKFLDRCPFVQNLSLHGYQKEVKDVVLRDLMYLELDQCEALCMLSVLNQASKYSLRSVDIIQNADVLIECDFPVCSTMDSVWVVGGVLADGRVSKERQTQALDRVANLFPENTEVSLNIWFGECN